jgi:hypothetical protein
MTQENKDLENSNELHDDAIQEIHQKLIKDKELPKEGFSFLPIALIKKKKWKKKRHEQT